MTNAAGLNLVLPGEGEFIDDYNNYRCNTFRQNCLCLSERYIMEHYSDIMKYEGCIENRIDDGYCTIDLLIRENARFREGCAENNLSFVLIDNDYKQTIEKILY